MKQMNKGNTGKRIVCLLCAMCIAVTAAMTVFAREYDVRDGDIVINGDGTNYNVSVGGVQRDPDPDPAVTIYQSSGMDTNSSVTVNTDATIIFSGYVYLKPDEGSAMSVADDKNVVITFDEQEEINQVHLEGASKTVNTTGPVCSSDGMVIGNNANVTFELKGNEEVRIEGGQINNYITENANEYAGSGIRMGDGSTVTVNSSSENTTPEVIGNSLYLEGGSIDHSGVWPTAENAQPGAGISGSVNVTVNGGKVAIDGGSVNYSSQAEPGRKDEYESSVVGNNAAITVNGGYLTDNSYNSKEPFVKGSAEITVNGGQFSESLFSNIDPASTKITVNNALVSSYNCEIIIGIDDETGAFITEPKKITSIGGAEITDGIADAFNIKGGVVVTDDFNSVSALLSPAGNNSILVVKVNNDGSVELSDDNGATFTAIDQSVGSAGDVTVLVDGQAYGTFPMEKGKTYDVQVCTPISVVEAEQFYNDLLADEYGLTPEEFEQLYSDTLQRFFNSEYDQSDMEEFYAAYGEVLDLQNAIEMAERGNTSRLPVVVFAEGTCTVAADGSVSYDFGLTEDEAAANGSGSATAASKEAAYITAGDFAAYFVAAAGEYLPEIKKLQGGNNAETFVNFKDYAEKNKIFDTEGLAAGTQLTAGQIAAVFCKAAGLGLTGGDKQTAALEKVNTKDILKNYRVDSKVPVAAAKKEIDKYVGTYLANE